MGSRAVVDSYIAMCSRGCYIMKMKGKVRVCRNLRSSILRGKEEEEEEDRGGGDHTGEKIHGNKVIRRVKRMCEEKFYP